MTTLLHVIASPRGAQSRTLQIAQAVIARFKELYPVGDIDEIDLFEEELPVITPKRIEGKQALSAGLEIDADLEPSWKRVEAQIERFLSADKYLFSVPMWNFGIPYVLKHYIDVIIQPRYMFQYGANGPEGLVRGKPLIIASSRGGDYSSASPAAAMDQLEPYLRTVFGFIGFGDIRFINAQPMDAGDKALQESRLAAAQQQAGELEF